MTSPQSLGRAAAGLGVAPEMLMGPMAALRANGLDVPLDPTEASLETMSKQTGARLEIL